jgi:hypothetical protein
MVIGRALVTGGRDAKRAFGELLLAFGQYRIHRPVTQ